jgi:ribosomal protein S27E
MQKQKHSAVKPSSAKSLLAQAKLLSEQETNALYGLEPVYEAGSDPRMQPLGHFVSVRCPHCFERYDTDVETIYGSFERVEDCQICCRPIALRVDIENGDVKRLNIERVG